jgi:hypothetical protein
MIHAQPGAEPEVTIRLLSQVPEVTESLEKKYYEVEPRTFRMSVGGVAHYLVEDGNRISVEPAEGATLEKIRLFLLGSAMGALLYQRGLFPLHGSAIETPWGAMIFVGPQGVGKSTLGSQFHRKGYKVLSDDVCAVTTAASVGASVMEVLPALAHFRLCTDAFERLGVPESGIFHVDKFVVPLGEGYCSHPVPLKAIHVLGNQESGDPIFEVLRGFDRVKYLLENLYRPEYLERQSTQSDLMRMAGAIAQQSAVIKVTRRRDTALIPATVDFLESAWEETFGPPRASAPKKENG